MIYQLSNGQIIELSLEQYLDLSDLEIQELIGINQGYTKSLTNPLENLFSSELIKEDVDSESLDIAYSDDDEDFEDRFDMGQISEE